MADEEKRLRVSGPGSGRRGARVIVRARREGAKLADPTPDAQGTDITGGWEDASVANLRVNRAGTHLEGWLLDYRTKQITEIGGDLQGQEIFEIRDSPNASRVLGTLHVIDDRELRFFRTGEQPLLLRRVDREPGLSDNALRAFPPALRDRIRQEQRQPLSVDDRRRVIDGLSSAQIGPFIDRFVALDNSNTAPARAARAFVVQELDRHVGRIFNAIDTRDHAQAQSWARLRLSSERHTAANNTQSLLNWIQTMVPVASILSNDPAPNVRQHLNIEISTRLFHYTFTITTGVLSSTDVLSTARNPRTALKFQVGLGAGVFAGTLKVEERTGPGPNDPIIAEFELPLGLVQVGVGFGVSLGGINNGGVSTTFRWTENDFPGTFKILDLQGAGVISLGLSGVFFSGSGRFPELAADFSGFGWNFGFGAGLAEGFGFISPRGATPQRFTIPGATEYPADPAITQAIHFPFGIAELTPEARQILRVMAAQELAMFRAGQAVVVAEAHADRVDTEEFNVLLTKCRAFNTILALQDILGASYKPKEHRRVGLGETGATAAGDPDDTENPERRRVDVSVNGRVVVKLRGEGRAGP